MAVKNYVVCTHRKIASTKWIWKDTSAEGDVYDLYGKMRDESLASFKHFLEGDWEYIEFNDPIEHINEAMPRNCDLIYDLWHKEPCNILWKGPDVQAVKPLKIFDEFTDFRLFNWTDPKSMHEPNQYNLTFDNFFNNDLHYMPHTMDPKLWEMERAMRKEWDTGDGANSYNNWQIVNNAMFWSQGLEWEDAHRPELFYQAQWIPKWASYEQQDAWNNCTYDEAQVIHWHASRHAPTKLACMRAVNEALGITVEYTKE